MKENPSIHIDQLTSSTPVMFWMLGEKKERHPGERGRA